MSLAIDQEGREAYADAGERWHWACRAAELTAVDPIGTGGILVSGAYGPVQQAWVDLLRNLAEQDQRLRRLPAHITEDRLLGGLDLTATLQSGRPVVARGLLAEADGDILILPSAERMQLRTASHIAAARDLGGVNLQRDGADVWTATRFGLVAIDESLPDEDGVANSLRDRLGIRIDLGGIPLFVTEAERPRSSPAQIGEARRRLKAVRTGDDAIVVLCNLGLALGIGSLRPPTMALAVARANAALFGREAVNEDDLAAAVRLCLAWRATRVPELSSESDPEEPEPPADQQANADSEPDQQPDDPDSDEKLKAAAEDRLLEAARASLPADLLAAILSGATASRRSMSSPGRTGLQERSKTGRARAGVMPGDPRTGAPLSVFATLLAAAPKQGLRKRDGHSRTAIRPEDFRVYRMRQQRQTVTIFVVDASGSAAINRLAEAKGAVELLLNECYVRRDQVALIAFRGQSAQILLPPTSALARAKRSLASLPGGGGTPLASGLAAAALLAEAALRRGQTPLIAVLTDGRANVALDGRPGRADADADAMREAQRITRSGHRTLVIDTSVRPDPRAERLATALAARYLPLPRASSGGIKEAVMGTMRP